jgi:hypothetical protein
MAAPVKIDVPILGFNWCPVVPDAEIVDVAPHLLATFVVHPTIGLQGGWTCTEVETGAHVLVGIATRARCVRYARQVLEHVDQRTLARVRLRAVAHARRLEQLTGKRWI